MVRKKECDGSQAWWSEKRKRSLQYICCRRQGESETTHAHREETDLFTHCRVLASSPTTAYSTIDCTGHDGLAGSFFLLSPQWGWMEANGSLRKQRAHSGRLTHVSTVMVLNAPTSHTPPPGLCVEQINPHLDQILTKSRRGSQARGSYIHTCKTGTNLQRVTYMGVRQIHGKSTLEHESSTRPPGRTTIFAQERERGADGRWNFTRQP